MRRVRSELRIAGGNLFLLAAALSAALILLAALSGELLPAGVVSSEVILPFFTAVAVSEWGRTRSDGSFEVIAAQSRSLFRWVLIRTAAVFGVCVLFSLACLAAVCALRPEQPFWELTVAYLAPALLLVSLSALAGLYSAQEHAAALVCGILWLAALLARGLLRLPGVEDVYLFLRFAGDEHGVWPVNKAVLSAAGLLLWWPIRHRCRKMDWRFP